MSMVASPYWTADMVRALPDDGQRYETVHGELLVTPAPRTLHQRVLRRLSTALDVYLARERVGESFFSPADISWGTKILVQPDLFVVVPDEARTLDWTRMKHLLLVVEILSPSSLRADRHTKRALYQSVGVETYWVVDADARAVEVWTPDADFPVVEDEVLRWQPVGATQALEISLAELFAD
jgi:Uma2 family endonuclease